MINYVLLYSNAGSSRYSTIVFKAKSLNDAISCAKRWCKHSNKELLGVVNARAYYDNSSIF